jgi:hypothetical protein
MEQRFPFKTMVETRSMVTHDKTNERWKGLGLMGYDELRDMRCLVPWGIRQNKNTCPIY